MRPTLKRNEFISVAPHLPRKFNCQAIRINARDQHLKKVGKSNRTEEYSRNETNR